MSRRLLTVLCAFLLWFPSTLPAQVDTASYSADIPGWVGQFTTASANMLLGGITAGVVQELKGGSFRDGFTRGAFGGLIIYGGKRIAAERFDGAGLIGRQVNAVGASVVRNAADGVGTFDRLVLPVGVARIYWQRAPQSVWRAKIDALALGWTVYGVVESQLDFDLHQTLSAGTPVFKTDNQIIDVGGGTHAGGTVQTGVVFLSDVPQWGREFLERAQAHERVHVLQMDQIFLTMNDPHDDQLLTRLPAGSAINRWVDLNLSTEALQLLARGIRKHGDRPWEIESIYLSR